MQRPSRRLLAAFVFVSLPLATVLSHAQAGPAQPTQRVFRGPRSHACSTRASTPAPTSTSSRAAAGSPPTRFPPTGRAGGVSTSSRKSNDVILRRVLEAAAGRSRRRPRRRSATTTRAAWTRQAIERRGVKPLDPDLKNIAALAAVNRLPELVAELHKIGVGAFFSFGSEPDFKNASIVIAGADQGGMGLPDRDYYFRDDARSVEIRKQYVEHVAKLLTLAGAPAAQARQGRRRGDAVSKRRWPRRRSTACRGATRKRCTTG